jgi:hypothetical protein
VRGARDFRAAASLAADAADFRRIVAELFPAGEAEYVTAGAGLEDTCEA